jgi:hypothetical protein
MPFDVDLVGLQQWVKPLLEEERRAKEDGASLSSNGR